MLKARSNFILGLGGVGMSALAQFLIDRGEKVSGADRLIGSIPESDYPPALIALRNQGVKILADDGSGIDETIDRIIVSTAIEETHPALKRAEELKIPVVHRAQALSQALKPNKVLAVAGTCGKSTVTAILGHILEGAGFDPVVVNGAAIPGWDFDNTRVGSVRKPLNSSIDESQRWAIVEVDESDKSLTSFSPHAAIITNASADHFGIEETDALFDHFKSQVSGIVIDCRKESKYVEGLTLNAWSGSFTEDNITYTIPQPGEHNVHNARVAIKIASLLGADSEKLKAALATFPGVARRMQKLTDEKSPVAVIDDYAHNTEKLHAMWTALQAAFPKGVAVVWRPHGYAPLRKMINDLAEMFSRTIRPQDKLLLLPVYDAGGTATRDINSDILLEKISNCNVELTASIEDARKRLIEISPSVEAIVTAGARDPQLPVLAKQIHNYLKQKEKNNV